MKVLEKGHISDVALENYSLDHLAEPELEVVEEHILICPTCQDRLAEIDDFVRAFRMAHAQLENTGAGKTQIVGDGWIAEPEVAVYAPSLAWFQKPSLWAGVAFASALLVAIPFLSRTEQPSAQRTAVAVQLVAKRGAAAQVSAPEGHLALQLDMNGLNEDQVLIEVATWNGRKLWSRTVALTEAARRVSPDIRFTAGQYWIRVRPAGSSELLREFSLNVTR